MQWAGIILAVIAAVGVLSSSVFLALALIGARKFHRDAQAQAREFEAPGESELPFVSLMKPLHGMEPQLEENIESFFTQDYPQYEILFAVDTEEDAAIAVARRVMARHPERPARIIVNGNPPWPNPPAYSFSRMVEVAKSNLLVTSDSDVVVERNYLREVVPPLLREKTGMLTCVYRGLNRGGFWSLMDAIGMSVEMTAGVVIANWMEGMKFGLGPTIVVRRDALDAIGGYRRVGEYFSNDFVIGNFIEAAGFHIELSRHVITHVVPPMSFKKMWQRQVRWAAGTRRSRPMGHLGTGLVFAVPYGLMALAAAWMLGHPAWGAVALAWTLANRMIEAELVGWGVVRDRVCLTQPWLYAVRDLLGFIVWCASYMPGRITWRAGLFELMDDGRVRMRDHQGRVVEMK